MCAEGVAVMDGAVSTMMQTHHPGISQPPYSFGTERSVNEEISAMLQSNHANIGVSAPGIERMSPSSYPFHLYPGGFAAGSRNSVPNGQSHVRGSPPPRFNMEEKYILEAKTEILDAAALRNGATYGAVYETPGGGLHRYHSAPASTFLTEMNEGPGQIGNHVMSLYADGGLTPITENMDMDRNNFNNSGEYEHYMAPENDFARRAAFPGILRKDEAMPDTFGTTTSAYQASKNGNLLQRQTSLPSVGGLSQLNTSLHDRLAENGSEKSSSRNSDDCKNNNNHLINGYTASMYSQEDFLWKSPTSPAKRHRGIMEGESETSSGGSADGSTHRNHGGSVSLVRHMSLPTSSGVVDDMTSFGTVPMRTRAKRGCATHPRSIAERVRRTKISERMKRLQDLVPDMDKQTNTSDMLDETVEYVKSLQQKVHELNETVAQLKAAATAQQHQHQQQSEHQHQPQQQPEHQHQSPPSNTRAE